MKELMIQLGFNEEEQAFFSKLYESLKDSDLKEFDRLKSIFLTSGTDEENEDNRSYVNEQLIILSKNITCHEFSLHILFLLYCCPDLLLRYEKEGLCKDYYYNLISDITCKMRECEQVYNVIGTNSFKWFYNHFNLKLFALGRFQYVKGAFRGEKEYRWKNICINPGDSVYYIHIPSGGSMTEEERLSSYKKAFDFFGKNYGDYIVLVCDSWLLYPQNEYIFPEHSNLMGFLKDFDIISSTQPNEPFRNAWRVFNKNYEGDTSLLPSETTLQKNYIKWLNSGNKVGDGCGIIVFDGEKIVNKDKH